MGEKFQSLKDYRLTLCPTYILKCIAENKNIELDGLVYHIFPFRLNLYMYIMPSFSRNLENRNLLSKSLTAEIYMMFYQNFCHNIVRDADTTFRLLN